MKTSHWLIALAGVILVLSIILWQMSISIKSSDFLYILIFSFVAFGALIWYLFLRNKAKRELKLFEIVKKIEEDWKKYRNEDLFIDDTFSKAETTTVEELNKRYLTFHFKTNEQKNVKIRWDTVLNDICGFNYDLSPEQLEKPFDADFDPWKSKSKTPIREKETIKEIYGDKGDDRLKDKKMADDDE